MAKLNIKDLLLLCLNFVAFSNVIFKDIVRLLLAFKLTDLKQGIN